MEWNIKSRSETCAVTGAPFKDGEVFYTTLLQQGKELARKDLSAEAWELRRPEDPQPLCFWRSVFKEEPAGPEEPVKHEDAEDELRRMLEKNDPKYDRPCCLLAVLLERKRILRQRERTQVDGRPVIIYEHAHTQETFLIRDVDMKLAEIPALQENLGEIGQLFVREKPAEEN